MFCKLPRTADCWLQQAARQGAAVVAAWPPRAPCPARALTCDTSYFCAEACCCGIANCGRIGVAAERCWRVPSVQIRFADGEHRVENGANTLHALQRSYHACL